MENESADDSSVQDEKHILDELDGKLETFESEQPVLENGDIKEEPPNVEENNIEIKSEQSENLEKNELEEEATEGIKSAAKREAESEETEPVPKKKSKKSDTQINGDINETHYDEPEDEIESESDEEVCKWTHTRSTRNSILHFQLNRDVVADVKKILNKSLHT